MKYALAFAFVFLASPHAHASGTTVGNGGDSVVCYNADQTIKSVTFFDYYEANVIRNIDIDLGAPSLSVDQKVNIVLDRIRRLNPNRAKRYALWYAKFLREARFVSGVELVDVPDSGTGYYPVGCSLKQTAIHQEPHFPGDARYTINKDIWDKMDNTNRAGLILHELIFREAVNADNRHTNSISVRYYHSQVASHLTDSMSLKEYIELLKLVQLRWADTHDGLPFPVFTFADEHSANPIWNEIDFYSDNLIKHAPFDRACQNFGFPITFLFSAKKPL